MNDLEELAAEAECRGCRSTFAECRTERLRDENDAPFGCCDRCEHSVSVGELHQRARHPGTTPRAGLDKHLTDSLAAWTYLNQGKVWIPKRPARPVAIADMSPEWRYNCARYLLRHAAGFADRYGWGLLATGLGPLGPSGDAACDAFEALCDEHDRMAAEDPQGWMRTTTLFGALTARLPTKPQRLWRIAQRARHWHTCAASRSNNATCTCTPGSDAAAPAGLPTPVLVVAA